MFVFESFENNIKIDPKSFILELKVEEEEEKNA